MNYQAGMEEEANEAKMAKEKEQLTEFTDRLAETDWADALLKERFAEMLSVFSAPEYPDALCGARDLSEEFKAAHVKVLDWEKEIFTNAFSLGYYGDDETKIVGIARTYLMESAVRYYARLAVELFLRLGRDIEEASAEETLTAYQEAAENNLTADVGKQLTFYRLWALGALSGNDYSERYADFCGRIKAAGVSS